MHHHSICIHVCRSILHARSREYANDTCVRRMVAAVYQREIKVNCHIHITHKRHEVPDKTYHSYFTHLHGFSTKKYFDDVFCLCVDIHMLCFDALKQIFICVLCSCARFISISTVTVKLPSVRHFVKSLLCKFLCIRVRVCVCVESCSSPR